MSYKTEAKASRSAKMSKYASGGRIKPVTPQVQDAFTRAIRNSGSDEELVRIQRIAKDRYGVEVK
jgi:hypothetical protein